MKLIELGTKWWGATLKYISFDDRDVIEKHTDKIDRSDPPNHLDYVTLTSGHGWSFLTSRSLKWFIDNMKNCKSAKTYTPMGNKVKIVYRKPGERVYVIDQPHVPMFASMAHHHGKQKSLLDEDYNCLRCGIAAPDSVKTIVLAEHLSIGDK
jgi:hypothetical protein